MNVFDNNFVNNLKQTLETELADQKAIQRKDLCATMGLDECYQDILSFVVSNDVLPGYEIIPGRFGGIAKEGTKGSGRTSGKRNKRSGLTDEFVKALRETLFELCSDNKRHFRSAVAEAMGEEDIKKTEKLISDAFDAELLPEFEIVRGRYGGIKLRDEADVEDTDTETLVESTEDNDDNELVVADQNDDDDDTIDLTGYNLDDLDEDIQSILARNESEIQNKNIDNV